MGSVKNLVVQKEAADVNYGIGVFEFTDDFSVFDFGKMPDTIPGKGESLCRMASSNFRHMEKELGIKTHFRKMIS